MRESDYAHLYSVSFPFWGSIIVAQRARLCAVSRYIRVSSGTLISDGTREGVLTLRSGTARAFLLSEEGREISLFPLAAGDPFFFSVPDVSVPAGVLLSAETDCECCFIPHAAFAEIAARQPAMEIFALQSSLRRAAEINSLLRGILLTGVAQRIAAFLAEESARCGSRILSLTQEEIARKTGSAREVVSRTLKDFSLRGMVETGRGKLRITNPAALAEISRKGR